MTGPGEDDTRHPPVTIRDGGITIACNLASVTCLPHIEHIPVLAVEPGAAITDLHGPFRLARLNGRIIAHDRSIFRDRIPKWGWLTRLRATQSRGDTRRDHQARQQAKLLGFATLYTDVNADPDKDTVDLQGGHLAGVDVTELKYREIEHLDQLHVFDPDPTSLIHQASPETTDQDDAGERNERAQRLKRISEIVSARATSGATRSAALWAAARSQHASIRRRNRVERLARSAHRGVGYGYRPAPALFTYAIFTLALTAALDVFDSDPQCSDADIRKGPYSLSDQFARVLLPPVSLLRLELGGAKPYAPIGCSPGWHALAFASSGVC